MSQIGISDAEAHHLVGKQGSLTDELRTHIRTVESHVSSLAHSTYVSQTTQALMNKWSSETKPQFEKIIARAEAAQGGTTKAVGHQMSTQESNASAISAI